MADNVIDKQPCKCVAVNDVVNWAIMSIRQRHDIRPPQGKIMVKTSMEDMRRPDISAVGNAGLQVITKQDNVLKIARFWRSEDWFRENEEQGILLL